jgi:hypothetical protein
MKYLRLILSIALTLPFVMRCDAQLLVGSIRGTISDSSGAAIANAQVTLVQKETNFLRQTQSNDEGYFELPDLQSGTYSMTAMKSGFQAFKADDIILTAGQIRRIDVAMPIGSATANVTVTEGAAVIQTEGAVLHETLSSKDYLEKPWIGTGINPLLLLTVDPLVQNTGGGLYSFEIAGQPTQQTAYNVDGVGSDGSLNGTNVFFYKEANVAGGNSSSEFPRATQINLISHQGTDKFHGVFQYWYLGTGLTAKDYFAVTKPETIIKNEDLQLSGPIWKDKTLFLFIFEGQQVPGSTYVLQTVPTSAMRTGDFSQLLTGTNPVMIHDPVTKAPFPGNIIPSDRINSVSSNVLSSYIPSPNLGGPGALSNNYGYVFPYPGGDYYDLNNYMGRIDQHLTKNNSFFVRWQLAIPYYVLNGNYPSLFSTEVRHTYNFVVEDTHIFSPRFVNTARFGLYQPNATIGGTVDGKTPLTGNAAINNVGLQGINSGSFPEAGFPTMSISGYNSVDATIGGVSQIYKEWSYGDTTTLSLEKHLLRIGAELRETTDFDGEPPSGTFGSFSFNGSLSGNAFADFLLGTPYSASRVAPIVNTTEKGGEFGAFIDDTYKITPRLTVNLGLRWDRFQSATYENNLIYNWNSKTNQVVVPQSSLSKISPFYPVNLVSVAAGDARSSPTNTNFAPRLGFAYLVTPKTVVRGGYGIFNEYLGRFAFAQTGGPYEVAETYFNLQNSNGLLSFPSPFPQNGVATLPSQSVSGFPTDTQNGKIQEFNFTIERQIGSMGLRLTYYGSRNLNMNYSLGINKPLPSTIPFNASLNPYPNLVSTTYGRNNGGQHYNAGTVEWTRRRGPLTLDAHYTWASNLSNMLDLENPYAPLRWGQDPTTARNVAVFNAGYEVPIGRSAKYFKTMNWWEDLAFGGWRIDWITYLYSGDYFSPSFSGSDPSGTNTSGGFPSAIGNGNLPSDRRSINHWFDASAFVVPQAGTFGNSPINSLIGPGVALNDLSINKTAGIKEHVQFTFGAAVQNIFNHENFSNPAADISTSTVGVISSTNTFGGARQIMLRGRVEF